MIRDYKKDFCKENKESALLSKKFKKKVIQILVVEIILLVVSILTVIAIQKRPGLIEGLGFILGGLSIAVFIMALVRLKHKKQFSVREKVFNYVQIGLSIAQLLSLILLIALFVLYMFSSYGEDSPLYYYKEMFRAYYYFFIVAYLLILAAGLVITIILLSIASKSYKALDYSKSVSEFNKQCNYLKEPQTYKMVADLLKADDFEAASAEANGLQNKYVEQRKIDIENSHEFVEKMNLKTESEFDGKTIQYIGWNILGALVTVVTLGILYPVRVAWVEGWKINHRTINGKRLRFDGNGFQLLGRYILWWLLCIVTIGIYALFLPKKIQQWVTKHTHFVNMEDETEENRKLLEQNGIVAESKFEGRILAYIGWQILGFLVTVFTLGILYTVRLAWIKRWEINGQNINGLQMRFDGNGFQLLGKYILWWLLSIVTLGIFLLFLPVKIEKWVTKHTHFEKVIVDEEI